MPVAPVVPPAAAQQPVRPSMPPSQARPVPVQQSSGNLKSIGSKIGNTILTIMIILVLLLALAAAACCTLAYFEIVEIPILYEVFGQRDSKDTTNIYKPQESSGKDQPNDPDIATVPQDATTSTIAPAPTEDPAEIAYQNTQKHCADLSAAGNYKEVLQYLETCIEEYPNDARYENLLTDYRQRMKDSILDAAEDHAHAAQYRQAIEMLCDACSEYGDIDYYEAAVTYRRDFGIYNNSMIAAGKYNTVLVNDDGTVQICGDNSYGELSASYWTDITQVSAGDKHIVGLRKDGTVLAVGDLAEGQCNVLSWNNVIAISAGDFHTVGLLEDGTLVATGYNHRDQCNVDSIMDTANGQRIVSIAAGYVHTLALLENGRVAACGDNSAGACNIYGWTDIVSICAGSEFSAGLKADGTVVATGLGTTGWDLSDWTDIVQLSAGDYYLIGLRADGTVLSISTDTSDFSDRGQTNVGIWNHVAFVSAGNDHTVAINTDGKILCVGSDNYAQSAFKGFTLQP